MGFVLQPCPMARRKAHITLGSAEGGILKRRDADSHYGKRKRYFKGSPFISQANRFSLEVATLVALEQVSHQPTNFRCQALGLHLRTKQTRLFCLPGAHILMERRSRNSKHDLKKKKANLIVGYKVISDMEQKKK